MKRYLGKFILIPFIILIVRCSSDDKSQDVDITFVPENPITQLASFTYYNGDEETTVAAPWFQMRYRINNKSSKNLILQSLKLKITGVGDSGMTSAEVDLTAELLLVNQDSSETNNLIYLDTVPASTSKDSIVTKFFVGGLPDNNGGRVYQVEVLALGWFGSDSDPEEPFQRRYFFTTE